MRESKQKFLLRADDIRQQEEHISATVESKMVGTNNMLRLMPNSTPDFMHIPLDFLGFCLVNIVEKAILIPGKPNIGVFKYKEKYCVFSDEETAQKYIANPDYYLEAVVTKCRYMPELIHLLKLQDHFPDASLASLLQGKDGMMPLFSISAPLMVDKDVNTPEDGHFVEKHIEPNYHWNEWDLRKKAL